MKFLPQNETNTVRDLHVGRFYENLKNHLIIIQMTKQPSTYYE